MLDPFLPEKAEDVARLRRVQSDIHGHFMEWVRARRGGRLMGADADLFEGAFWTGTVALEYGIADDIGDVRGVMREKYGEDCRLIEFSTEKRRFPLPLGVCAPTPEDILAAIDDRAHWGRFGV